MRIGELGRRGGVPVPTIKFYLREGLLTYGEPSGPNQVHYDESHLRRLRLIRALIEIGGLSIARTRTVLDAVDDPDRSAFKALGVVHHAVSGDQVAAERVDLVDPDHGRDEVDALVARHGWAVGEGNPGRARLAELLTTLRELDQSELLARVDSYAELAQRLAVVDIDVLTERGAEGSDAGLETLAVATVLGDHLLATLRHLAQTHVARERASDAPAL